jgi:hypothetical protein
LGLTIGFDTKNLLGNLFELAITNKNYLNINQFYYTDAPAEIFFYEILENQFIFHPARFEKLVIFLNGSFALAYNARTIHSDTQLLYAYDPQTDTWDNMDSDYLPYIDESGALKYRYTPADQAALWQSRFSGNIITFDVGMVMSIVKNVDFGVSYNAPKFLIGANNIIGNQQNYGIIKIWTELKL